MDAPHRERYEDLLRRYLAPLRRLAWSYARDAADGEDLFQEIAMALWTALANFRGDCSERTWLYRVAHNTAIGWATSRKRRAARETLSGTPAEPAAPGSQERDLLQRERLERLQAAVRELPLADRQIVLLYLEGLAASEIEAVTGLSAGNVATRLTRIRQRLAGTVRRQESGQ